jgi:alanyl-tRNA synthetase
VKSNISGTQLREQFLQFFESRGHTRVSSAPLVPQGDDTLLFINAGMVQFKDLFTGQEKRAYTRATSSQKCVRAGGKHNDLENVGRTARHHTFFEMLGNFSFGDYFKEEACVTAWEFLTKELELDPKRLSVTVFGGAEGIPLDSDAERIWREVVGVPKEQISRMGMKDNFWAMGDTGPCGPCTEIHYDRGVLEGTFGGDDPEGDRILEVWNLVFMQYDRNADGELSPLPAPCVDTGMGLERLAMVLSGAPSNYDTDLLRPLIQSIEKSSGKAYGSSDSEDDVSMRVIADHARTTAFLMSDGIQPGNEGRNYVLRRIMRRAIRHGSRLGFDSLFFYRNCLQVVEMFGDVYPELRKAASAIEKLTRKEEELFRQTLDRGLTLFQKKTSDLGKDGQIDGNLVFDLNATFGFPPDLTETLAQENGWTIDWKSYDIAKEKHAQISGAGLGLAGIPSVYKDLRQSLGASRFLGYDQKQASGQVVAVLKDDSLVERLQAGDQGAVLLDQTPFYGESGGQVGDTGTFSSANMTADVVDTKKILDLHLHQVKVTTGDLSKGAQLNSNVDNARLANIQRNHSATHLLHKALRDVLGDHVTQKGSLVDGDRLRFDFSHFESVTPKELQVVENQVYEAILKNAKRQTEEMSFDRAQEMGAVALFGEKYGDAVRVVKLGDSVELCGGIHVESTGEIGLFKIISESPLAAGIRRIEAVTGMGAMEWVRKKAHALAQASSSLKVNDDQVSDRIHKLKREVRDLEKELNRFRQKEATASAGEAISSAIDVSGVKVLAQKVEGIESKSMREYADKLRDQLGSGIVVLGAPTGGGKCTLLVALTKDMVGRLHAGKIVGELAQIIGGKGGGRPDFAQAGGSDLQRLDEALNQAVPTVDALLQSSS